MRSEPYTAYEDASASAMRSFRTPTPLRVLKPPCGAVPAKGPSIP